MQLIGQYFNFFFRFNWFSVKSSFLGDLFENLFTQDNCQRWLLDELTLIYEIMNQQSG
jgi:hypothetical protein